MARKSRHKINLSSAMAELTEIRQALGRQKSEQREERAIQRAFEDGQTAQLSGEPLTRCRLKLPARRNAWERGWHEAHRVMEEERARRSLKPEDSMRIRDAIKGLRDQFGFLRKT